MGLIARAIEASGVATTSLTSAWSITASANPPRAVFNDFPLGHTAGVPGDREMQLAIARSALEAAWTMPEPGITVLDHQWPGEWRDDARGPVDHRTERLETPQYQNEDDRAAAIAAHGEGPACGC